MRISIEEIAALASKMRLALSDAELARYARELCELEELARALLPYGSESGQILHPVGLEALREDRVTPSMTHDEVFLNAACRSGEYLVVPRVIGEGKT